MFVSFSNIFNIIAIYNICININAILIITIIIISSNSNIFSIIIVFVIIANIINSIIAFFLLFFHALISWQSVFVVNNQMF